MLIFICSYQEIDVLVLQAKSTMDLVRVLSNRKRLLTEKLQKRMLYK